MIRLHAFGLLYTDDHCMNEKDEQKLYWDRCALEDKVCFNAQR